MEKKIVRTSEILFIMLMIISLLVLGCNRQSPPPVQTPPPAGSSQTPPTVGTNQTTIPGGSAQMPAQTGSTQMPAPAGTVTTPQAGTPSRDTSQILVGMTPEQIQQIMGPPEQLYQQGFIEWKYTTPEGKFDVRFKDNKVILVEKYKK